MSSYKKTVQRFLGAASSVNSKSQNDSDHLLLLSPHYTALPTILPVDVCGNKIVLTWDFPPPLNWGVPDMKQPPLPHTILL